VDDSRSPLRIADPQSGPNDVLYPRLSAKRCQQLHEVPLGLPLQSQLDEFLLEDNLLTSGDVQVLYRLDESD